MKGKTNYFNTVDYENLRSFTATLENNIGTLFEEFESKTNTAEHEPYRFNIKFLELGISYRFVLYYNSFSFIKFQQNGKFIKLNEHEIDFDFIINALSNIDAETYKTKTTTIDFDHCFSIDGKLNPEINTFVKKRLFEGHHCFILTYRFDELNKHRYPLSPTNDDLWEITAELFERQNVIFMNTQLKGKYLSHCLQVVEHVDDSPEELDSIRRFAPHVKRLIYKDNKISKY